MRIKIYFHLSFCFFKFNIIQNIQQYKIIEKEKSQLAEDKI